MSRLEIYIVFVAVWMIAGLLFINRQKVVALFSKKMIAETVATASAGTRTNDIIAVPQKSIRVVFDTPDIDVQSLADFSVKVSELNNFDFADIINKFSDNQTNTENYMERSGESEVEPVNLARINLAKSVSPMLPTKPALLDLASIQAEFNANDVVNLFEVKEKPVNSADAGSSSQVELKEVDDNSNIDDENSF